jgi:hypothetical protein
MRHCLLKVSPQILVGTALVVCFACGPGFSRAQQKDKWQRVYTGEQLVIEINASSVKFEPDHVLRVQFRTIFSDPETLPGTSGAKYKTRLEVLDFKAFVKLSQKNKILRSCYRGLIRLHREIQS